MPHAVGKSFKKVFVEITNRCNLACVFCPDSGRAKADMAEEAFAGLLAQLKPFTSHLALHVLGEPLLHPRLGQLFALCHAEKFQVNLTTNGTLLASRGPLLLTEPALRQVNISLHSLGGPVGAGNSAHYLDNALAFSRQAAARGIQVSLRIWDLPPGRETGGARWQERLLSVLEKEFALSKPLADTMAAGQGIKLAEGIYLSQQELFVWPSLIGPELGAKGTCRGMRDQCAILVDGTVVPCCLDAAGSVPLGNVFREGFAASVSGERAAGIARGFRERRLIEPLCRRCSYRQRFDRCRQRASS